MRINHNIAALNTLSQLNNASSAQSKSMEKLSSGLRINRAGDDAAGLAISEKMRGQIRGLDMASKNSQDGISLIQTAEGALSETHSILQRMKELATQAANGTNTDSDRGEIQKEINQLTSEINRIGNTTEFNTQKLLDGGASTNGVNAGTTEALGVAAKGGAILGLEAVSFTNIPDDSTADSLTISVTDGAGTAQDFVLKGEAFKTLWDQTDAGKAGASATDAMKRDALVEVLGKASVSSFQLPDGSSRAVTLSEVADIKVSPEGIFSISSKIGGADIEIDQTGTTGDFQALLGITTAITAGDIVGKGTASEEASLFGSKSIKTTDELDLEDWAGKSFTVTYNGRTANITLAAEPTVADTTKQKITGAELVSAFNTALDATFGAGNVVASIGTDPNKVGDTKTYFQFTTNTAATDDVKGVKPEFRLSGDNLDKILGSVAAGSSEIGGTFVSKFQIGANQGQSFEMNVDDMRAQALGISGTTSGGNGSVDGAKYTAVKSVNNGTDNVGTEYALDVSTFDTASSAIKVLDNAITQVSSQRSQLGAYQNRLEHTINNLTASSENLTAAESRIRDVDMAKEMMEQTKNSILAQAAQAMLAQANQQPQGVLQLLR
jgi:Flagellin and related hook-associated proteins